jgi:hypothetical protein
LIYHTILCNLRKDIVNLKLLFLAGQALKATFQLYKYLYKFTPITPKHMVNLYDKLVTPVMNYCSEVWVFHKATQIERAHLSFCKRLLGVKIRCQNAFVYGETGRVFYITHRYLYGTG